MSVVFPFVFSGKSFFGDIYRPQALVTFEYKQKKFKSWLVVDSGADFTVLPKYIANRLLINTKTHCIKETMNGVGGSSEVFRLRSTITAYISTTKRDVPVYFLDSNDIPPLLERTGFLDTFSVTFYNRQTIFS